MTSSDGNIRDIPWDLWITFKNQAKDEQDRTVNLDNWKPCCDYPDLSISKVTLRILAGISVSCDLCKQRATLSGLFGLTFSSGKQ